MTIKAVIAWRLAAMTLLGRETPELPTEVFFTQIQMRVLRHFASKRGLAAPDNLGLAVRTMGDLGRLPVPRARSAAGPSKDLGGLDPLDHHERSL